MTVYNHFYKPPYPEGPPITTQNGAPSGASMTLEDYDPPQAYNIRNFVPSVKSMSLSLADISYHSLEYLEGMPLSRFNSVDTDWVGGENWVGGGMDQDDLNLLDQDDMDVMTQHEIENAPGIGIKPDLNYAPGMRVSVSPSDPITYVSHYDFDVLDAPPFDEPTDDFFIELVLLDFPAQSSTPRFDLDQSYISFSSTRNNSPSSTDYIPFSASVNDLSAGGNTYFRVSRDLLVNSNISRIRRVDIHLVAVGGTATFSAQALRLVPDGYPYYNVEANTKTGRLQMAPYQSGGLYIPLPRPIMNVGTNKGKNFTQIVSFYSGHHSPLDAQNVFRVFLRSGLGQNEFFLVAFSFNRVRTQVSFYNGLSLLRRMTTDPIAEEKEHYAQLDIIDDQIRVTIWEAEFFTSRKIVFNSQQDPNPVWVERQDPGFVGLDLRPTTYDFTIDYAFSRENVLGEMKSNIFTTQSPVIAANLYANYSPPTELIGAESEVSEGSAIDHMRNGRKESGEDNGHFEVIPGENDVAVTIDPNTPLGHFPTFKVQKSISNSVISGVRYDRTFKITDPTNTSIQGSIRFDNNLADHGGFFRVVLFDRDYKNVVFTGNIPTGPSPNTWYPFSIPLTDSAFNSHEVNLQLHHFGKDYDNPRIGAFWLNGLRVVSESVIWDISNDNGRWFIPFYDAVNNPFEGVNFVKSGNQLQLRARALSSSSWINRYELTPTYLEFGYGELVGLNELRYDTLPEYFPGLDTYEDVPDFFPTYEDLNG